MKIVGNIGCNRAELTRADLTQADLTQGRVDPHSQMYGEMVLDSFNLNRPGMIIFRPNMIIRKVKENII